MNALLIEARSGRAVWADSFERRLQPSEIIELRDELANKVARTLAQPYGSSRTTGPETRRGRRPRPSAATIPFCASTDTCGRSTGTCSRACAPVERTIAAEPEYAEAFACLSLLYVDIVRFQFEISAAGIEPQERALSLARRAVELAPNSSWARYALGLATWFAGDTGGALETLEAAYALNPNDTTISASSACGTSSPAS